MRIEPHTHDADGVFVFFSDVRYFSFRYNLEIQVERLTFHLVNKTEYA